MHLGLDWSSSSGGFTLATMDVNLVSALSSQFHWELNTADIENFKLRARVT